MKTMIVVILALVLSACQNHKTSRINYADFVIEQGLVQQSRVQHFRFQGWQPLNSKFLILRSNQRKSYLIKLMSPCVDLPFAQSIKVIQGSARLLSAKFDTIIVPGQLRQECTIDNIYEMDKIQYQALLEFSNQTEEIRD